MTAGSQPSEASFLSSQGSAAHSSQAGGGGTTCPERERRRGRQRAGGGVEAKMGAYSWGEPEAQSEGEGDRNETAFKRRELHQH